VQYSLVTNTENKQHIVLWPIPSEVDPADVESEVQGYSATFGDALPTSGKSTTSYVCTAVYTTCSHWCPKPIGSKPKPTP
jgi:hypothetical protein